MSDDPAFDEKESAKRLPGYVPDLRGKLEYLLNERGGYALNEKGRRSKKRIDTQEELAEILGVDPSNLSRWCKDSRIPKLATRLPAIVEIFDCNGQSFRLDDLETFKRTCELNQPSWGRLINSAWARVDPAAVRPVNTGENVQARDADIEDCLEDEDIPFVAPGQAFAVEFVAPPGDGAVSAWAGWHVLMFCGDRDGFLTWLPRHKARPEFKGAHQFPVNLKELSVPKPGGKILRANRSAWGAHDVVLIVSRERVPPAMEAIFETQAKNKDLAGTLDQLAIWLETRIGANPPEAAVVRAPFFVGFAHGRSPASS